MYAGSISLELFSKKFCPTNKSYMLLINNT